MANADIGKRPIAEITAANVLVPLRKVEAAGNYETARRMRSVIGQVFRYAIATGLASNDPRGALITPKRTHRAALTDWSAFGELVGAVWRYPGAIGTRSALKLMILLYPRPGELRQATWSEFDLHRQVWTIPADRTKMRREHRKPLSELAVEVLKEIRNHTGNRPFAFPSVHRPTLNTALRRLGYTKEQATSHGFRATASTLLNESGKWTSDAIEAELGHLCTNEVRRAYHRALYWDERVLMAEWWSQELSQFAKACHG